MDADDPRKADADNAVDGDEDDGALQREVKDALTTLTRFRDDVGPYLDRRRLDGVITDMRSLLLTSPPSLVAKSRLGVYDTVWNRLLSGNAAAAPPHSPSASDLAVPIRNAWRYGTLVDIADRSRLSAALAAALGPGCEVGRAFASATHHAVTLVWRLLLESAAENDRADDAGRWEVTGGSPDGAIAKDLFFANGYDDDDDADAEPEQRRRRPNALVDGLQRKRRRYGLVSPPGSGPDTFIVDDA